MKYEAFKSAEVSSAELVNNGVHPSDRFLFILQSWGGVSTRQITRYRHGKTHAASSR